MMMILFLISDVDEIPNLKDLAILKDLKEKLIFLIKKCFIINLILNCPIIIWTGTKSCKKKYLHSPQWLRNIKVKKFPFYRLRYFFLKNKIF